MKYPWYRSDCPCIDCYCVTCGFDPLPGKVMHEEWEAQEKRIKERKKRKYKHVI